MLKLLNMFLYYSDVRLFLLPTIMQNEEKDEQVVGGGRTFEAVTFEARVKTTFCRRIKTFRFNF